MAWALVLPDGHPISLDLYAHKEAARREVEMHRPFGVEAGVRVEPVLITSGWMPIAEAPRDGTPVDVWCVDASDPSGGFRMPDAVWDDGKEWWRGEGGTWTAVSHFMPLPAPPQSEGA